MSSKSPVKLRLIRSEDLPFVYNSWLKSYRNSKAWQNVDNETYYKSKADQIEKALAFLPCYMLVDPKDEGHIYGYVIGHKGPEAFIVEYAYVKRPYRRLGLASALVKQLAEGLPIITTHWMPVCRHLGWRKIAREKS